MDPVVRHMSSLDPVIMVTETEHAIAMFEKLLQVILSALPQSATKSLLSIKYSQCMQVQTSRQNSKIFHTVAGLKNFLGDLSVAEQSMQHCGT